MSYVRVIPRDLFNEANLLKCLGRLYILLEGWENRATLEFEPEDMAAFDIVQDENSGAIEVSNITFRIKRARGLLGQQYALRRPLNSRHTWPLWVEHVDASADFEPVPVFTDAGEFTPEMRAFLGIGE